MVGHGCPREAFTGVACHCELTLNSPRSRRAWGWCALVVVSWLLSAASLAADELDVRVRVTWGGGEPRQWRGAVVAEQGEVRSPINLGTQANGPDDLVVERDTLRFTQPIPVPSDGLEFQILGTDDTTLYFEFIPLDKPEEVKKIEVSLIDFISSARFVHEEDLDGQGNFVQVQRAPGDRLRVSFERDSLVFSPGDEFSFSVQPHELGLTGGTPLRCSLHLHPVDSAEVLWKEQHDLRVDASGNAGAINATVSLPVDEGVYDLFFSVTQRRFADSLVPEKFVAAKPLMQRKVQLVVLGKDPPPASDSSWELVDEIDSADPKWWERLNWLPHWRVLPGMSPRGPLGDRPLGTRDYQGQKLKELAPGGWHATPIPVAEVGRPHLLELDYPNDLRQSLGISVLEPNAAGELPVPGRDSGLDTAAYPQPSQARLDTHRVVFWPRTKNPWLVLTNHQTQSPAAFGRIRVLAGPAALPPHEGPAVPRLASPGGGPAFKPRRLVAYYDKPLLAENFGAADTLETVTGRSHKDWQTFYLAALRLAEYLKYAGYDSVILPVAWEGATLYPSATLSATPKFDDGQLFQSGQDPLQKDVLEMLLRIFDREGLQLIPAVQFGVPLPALEEQLRVGATGLGGISMIGFLPGDPRPKYGHADSRQGAAPFYNPLDSRVQAAMRDVLNEVVSRCASHRSFGGLAIQLSPYGYAVLPDEPWCLDDATFARFATATQQPNPGGPDKFEQRLRIVTGGARESWLDWRAKQLTRFYEGVGKDLQRAAPGTQLLLLTTDLLNSRVLQSALRPRLATRSDLDDALLRHGIDAEALAREAPIRFLRPHRITTSHDMTANTIEMDPVQAAIDEHFQQADQNASLSLLESRRLDLPNFDQVRPVGVAGVPTPFAAYLLPTGARRRARWAKDLAALDSRLMADGGTMLPLGAEESTAAFGKIFRSLPDEPFVTVPSPSVKSSQIKVRMLQKQEGTFFYVVNPQSLATTVRIKLEAAGPCVATSCDHRPAPTFSRAGEDAVWSVALEPFDVSAIVCDAPVQIRSWDLQYDSDSSLVLTTMMQDLRVRLDQMQMQSFRPINVLANSDFEAIPVANQIPGWQVARNPGVVANIDFEQPYQGKQSLHLKVEGAKTLGWIKSDPFPLPRTGRIAVQAWIRTKDESRQPPLRISVAGTLANGQTYSRMSALGMDVDSRTFQPTKKENVPTVPEKWSAPVLLPLTDLPVGTTGELAVGFEMLGEGEVWIDRVEVSDTYFDKDEVKSLLKNVASAIHKLQDGDLAYCEQVAQSYWAKFVLEYVPSPRLAQAPAAAARPEPELGKPPATPEEKPSKWGKMLQPKIPFIQRR